MQKGKKRAGRNEEARRERRGLGGRSGLGEGRESWRTREQRENEATRLDEKDDATG